MTKIENRLKSLYDKKDIHVDVRAYLESIGVETTDDLATLCDSKDQVSTLITNKVDSQKDVPQQHFRMKQVWLAVTEMAAKEAEIVPNAEKREIIRISLLASETFTSDGGVRRSPTTRREGNCCVG